MQTFSIREATASDVPAIGKVHVDAFKETHGRFNAPKYALRLRQWTGLFAKNDGSWFMFVIERDDAEIVGFVKGNLPKDDDPPTQGHLHKIYILRRYHRLGLGRRLLGHLSRRFLSNGVVSMTLFGEARNRSNGF